MKLSNKYDLTSTFNINGNIFGKALNIIKSIFTNAANNDSISGECVIDCHLSGEVSVEVSTEELIELYKEYGDDFSRQVKFLKEELRPCLKEFMGAIDDSAKSFQKTLHECEDREWLHEEKVKAERAAAAKKSE